MTILVSILGTASIVVALWDIFRTLFSPTGTGAMTSFAARHVWRGFRRLARHRSGILALSGPLALLCIIALWALSLAIGWALIIWPHLPGSFLIDRGLDPVRNDGFLAAFYLSLVTLATLGYGDIAPESSWLRIILPMEALIGFALMTAAISWILSVHPVLARRNHLAREALLLKRSERYGCVTLTGTDNQGLDAVLLNLTEQVVAFHNDLAQFPIAYYFYNANPHSAIEVALPELASIARDARHDDSPATRFQAALLLEALTELASYLGETFLDDEADTAETLEEMLAAYAADHGRELSDGPGDGDIAVDALTERLR